MKALVKKLWKRQHDGTPLYRQIATFLGAAIKDGTLKQHYVLPGHRQLAAMFGVGINTVLHAMQMLEQENLIVVSERSHAVVGKAASCAPDWDTFMDKNAYNSLSEQNFYHISETRQQCVNLAMGLDKDYYFRNLFNEVMPHVIIPPVLETSPYGAKLLREKLCEYNASLGIEATPDQVMIVTSVTHALNIIIMSLLGKKTTLLIAQPSNLLISNLVHTTGSAIVELAMDEQGILPFSLAKALQKYSGCILFLSPDCNIPTGTVMSYQRRKEILAICGKHRAPIVEHTVFPLRCSMSGIPSLKSMDVNNCVIHVSQIGVSASTNPWLGWVIMDERLMKKLDVIRFNFDAHQNYMVQLAFLEVLSRNVYDTYLEHICSVRTERQKAVANLLNTYLSPYATWNTQNLDACVWLRFKKGINVSELYREAVDVTFQLGSLYGQQYHTYIYLSPLTVNVRDFEFGLSVLAETAQRIAHDGGTNMRDQPAEKLPEKIA
jgi:GntR family transcriptional regulator of abcA and norABC